MSEATLPLDEDEIAAVRVALRVALDVWPASAPANDPYITVRWRLLLQRIGNFR